MKEVLIQEIINFLKNNNLHDKQRQSNNNLYYHLKSKIKDISNVDIQNSVIKIYIQSDIKEIYYNFSTNFIAQVRQNKLNLIQ